MRLPKTDTAYTNCKKNIHQRHRLHRHRLDREPLLEAQILSVSIDKEMGRCQGDNTLNNIKNSVAQSKAHDSTAVRLERHNTEEAEDNDLKNNFMTIIEALEEGNEKST